MKFLEAFCAYMEGVADGMRLWCDVVAGVLLVMWVLTVAFVKDANAEQMGCILRWCVGISIAGLLSPPEKVWHHWRCMLEMRNERD